MNLSAGDRLGPYEILSPLGEETICYLGPHAPHLTPKEIDLLHAAWLDLSNEMAPEELHHHDVIHLALNELIVAMEHGNSSRERILNDLRDHLRDIQGRRTTNH